MFAGFGTLFYGVQSSSVPISRRLLSPACLTNVPSWHPLPERNLHIERRPLPCTCRLDPLATKRRWLRGTERSEQLQGAGDRWHQRHPNCDTDPIDSGEQFGHTLLIDTGLRVESTALELGRTGILEAALEKVELICQSWYSRLLYMTTMCFPISNMPLLLKAFALLCNASDNLRRRYIYWPGFNFRRLVAVICSQSQTPC
jgi:hypothetical protein